MKTLYIVLFYLISIFDLKADDWSPFPYGQSNYYSVKDYFSEENLFWNLYSDRLIEYLYDSSEVKSEYEKIYYSFTYNQKYKGKCEDTEIFTQNINDPRAMQNVQYKLFSIKKDIIIINEKFPRGFVVDYGIDSILIFLPLKMSNGEIKEYDDYSVKLESKGIGQVLPNLTDSLMKFTLTFNKFKKETIQYVLSKHYGFVSFYALDNSVFKDSYVRMKMELTGFRTKDNEEVGLPCRNVDTNYANTYLFKAGDVRYWFKCETTDNSFPKWSSYQDIKDSIILCEKTEKSINLFIKRILFIDDKDFQTVDFRDTIYLENIKQIFKNRNNNFLISQLPYEFNFYRKPGWRFYYINEIILKGDLVKINYLNFHTNYLSSVFMLNEHIDTITCSIRPIWGRLVFLHPELGITYERLSGDGYSHLLYLVGYKIDGKQYGDIPSIFNSINELNDEYLSLFPNPVTSSFSLSNIRDGAVSYEIFDILGLKRCEGLIEKEMDVSFLPSGVYFLKLNNQAKPIKFVKI